MTIQLDGTMVSTTMRTPGHDYELAVGFCHTEGLLAGVPVTRRALLRHGRRERAEFNVVTVETGGRAPAPTPRLGITSSSCGWCGSDQLDDLCDRLAPLPARPTDAAGECSARMPRAGRRARNSCSPPPAPSTPRPRSTATATSARPRGRRSPQRGRQARRRDAARRRAPGHRSRAVRQRPGERRDGAEGVGRRVRHARGGQRADGARRRRRPPRQPVARRFRARRPASTSTRPERLAT